jgi:phage shock protein C
MSTVSRPRAELRRSRSDRIIGGVCTGLAKYFDVDPVIVRLLFVVMALAQGAGVLLYLVLLVVIPEEDAQPSGTTCTEASAVAGVPEAGSGAQPSTAEPRRRRGMWAGALLIGLGAYLLIVNLGFLWWWDWRVAGPVALIGSGFALLFWRLRR